MVFHKKYVEEDSIVEMKVWQVPVSDKQPLGYKYSLYWTKDGIVLVGYDNHHPKGPHKHFKDQEEPYEFSTLEKLVSDFEQDRRRIKNEDKKN